MLCPNCRKLISSDEPVCPYCGMARPGSAWKKYISKAGGSYGIINVILYTNIAFYVLSILINPSGIGFSENPLAFLSPSNRSLLFLGATGTIPISLFHRWWTLISASFLHGSILHIFFNMAAFWQLSPFVVQEYGSSRFVTIYIISGILGFFVSYLAGVRFTIGASANICGLIGAILYYGKTRGGIYGQAIYRQAMGWVIGLALFGFLVPGINNWAHGGGIAGGALLGLLLGYEDQKRGNLFHKIIAACCIFLTGGVLFGDIVQVFYHILGA